MNEELINKIRILWNRSFQEKENKIKNGEFFNLISIMKMENKEEKTHSNIIAELLNPKGLHHKGDVFLNLFLKTLNIKSFNTKKVKVYLEYFTGNIEYINNEISNNGGRIDIYITDDENHIAIENKIYADDQPRQLIRYNNFLKERTNDNKKKHLIYLNLKGSKPSIKSIKSLHSNEILIEKNDFEIIKYKEEIIEWLDGCIEITRKNTDLNHNIRQYRDIIIKLTNGNNSKYMEEIKEIAKNNIDAIASIFSNFNTIDDLLKYSLQEFCNNIVEELKTNENFKSITNKDLYYGTNKEYKGIWIKYKNTWLFLGEGDGFYLQYNSNKRWTYIRDLPNYSEEHKVIRDLSFNINDISVNSKLVSIVKYPEDNKQLGKLISDSVLNFIDIDINNLK